MIVAASAPHQRFTLTELADLHAVLPNISSALLNDPAILGHVILGTCHRVEIYAQTDDLLSFQQLISPLIEEKMGVEALNSLGWLSGTEVVEHLLGVASGLSSVVVGENEIAGQVKSAMGAAQDRGTMTPDLNRLFQLATRTAKAVARTDLGRQGRSLISAALGSARVGSALIIGTGSFARVAYGQLRNRSCDRILVFSPSGRAARFAANHPSTAVEGEGLVGALQQVDLVLGCSGQGEPTLTTALVEQALANRGEELRIVDLALRPDAAAEVANLRGVRLTRLDEISLESPVDDRAAREIVARGVAEYLDAEAEKEVMAGVLNMREQIQKVTQAELRRLLDKGGLFDERQIEELGLLVHRISQGILHAPTVRAKEAARSGRGTQFAAATKLVFGDSSQVDQQTGKDRIKT